MSQRCFDNIHMTGIDTEWETGSHSHCIDGLQHHFFFIDTVHPHINVQDICAHGFLLFRHLCDQIQIAFPERSLQLFLAGRVNAFSDDKETAINIDLLCFAFRGKYTVNRCIHWLRRHVFCGSHKLCNVFRRSSAASA